MTYIRHPDKAHNPIESPSSGTDLWIRIAEDGVKFLSGSATHKRLAQTTENIFTEAFPEGVQRRRLTDRNGRVLEKGDLVRYLDDLGDGSFYRLTDCTPQELSLQPTNATHQPIVFGTVTKHTTDRLEKVT